jgi:hypothetical protein
LQGDFAICPFANPGVGTASTVIEAVSGRLRKAGVQFITPDVVAIPQEAQAQLGFKRQ